MASIDSVDPMIQAILVADCGDTRRLLQKAGPHCCSSKEQSTPPSADHASAKSAELHLQELMRSWDPENNDCSCACCIQVVEPEGNKAS